MDALDVVAAEVAPEIIEQVWTRNDIETLFLYSKVSVICLFALIAIVAILIFAVGFNSKNH